MVSPDLLARTVTLRSDVATTGCQVAAYVPLRKLIRTSGGSPLEKLVTTVAFVTAFPQSSATCTSIGLGQPTGEAKFAPSVRITVTSFCGVQVNTGPGPFEGSVVAGTNNRTLTTCVGLPSLNCREMTPR